MSKIIAICGKICSGKSYYAKTLKERENAVILSSDEVTYDLINNEQGEFYDSFSTKVNLYLRKKASEIVKAGCNVILDWGFWTKSGRQEITEFFKSRSIDVEWHYVEVEDKLWEENIKNRNLKVESGKGGSDFFVTEGLKEKTLLLFEVPTKDEIDVWYKFDRKSHKY